MFENIDEFEQMRHFKLAYKYVTEESLKTVRKSERPDFICKRSDNSLVGIEFTLVTRDPESSSSDNILNGVENMDGLDGAICVEAAIENKGLKRGEATWQLPDSSILVLSTPDCPISEMEDHLSEETQQICEESGFSEIWIADHTEIEAYGNVELFGLFPSRYWGYHPCPYRGKPYG